MERFDQFVELPRFYRDRSNPFELYDDAGFLYRFRLDRNTVLWLLDQLEGHLDKIQNKGVFVPPVIQLLFMLQFFGSGSILRNIGDIFGLHISTIIVIVYSCSRALASLYDQFIEFPYGAELQRVQDDFARIARLPAFFLPPGVACSTGLSYNRFAWLQL